MTFKRISPPDYLKESVESFWISEGTRSATLGAMADGRPGIVFHCTDGGLYLNHSKKLSTIFLYGQTVKPIEMNAAGRFRMIGLHFYPHVMKFLFGISAHELTDTYLDLSLLPEASGISLTERLLEAGPVRRQIEIISNFLFELIEKNNIRVDSTLHVAVQHLMKSNGTVPIKELRKHLNVSERSFERKFEQYVGVSPRMFSRICRFQASLNQMQNMDYCKLSDIAFDNGYADQSHFIRSFKEFTGISPLEYKKQIHKAIPNSPLTIKT
jgi:AraC-like DNA-binding protein